MGEIRPEEEMDPAESVFLAEMAKQDVINETIARGDSSVQQFYEDAVVLITGASGFLGKQLIEKLFRSCRIKKLYLLLRSKEEKTLQERVDYILQDELYEYLHKNQPGFEDKMAPVAGDITDHRLGLTENSWNILVEEVNVIIHAAATVNFLEPLKVATLTNVRGTREMLKLAQACKNLKSFVHVSTAYTHATQERVRQHVLEEFYPSPIPPSMLIELVEQLDEQTITQITPYILKNWPNTYAFTKAVTEELVRSMAQEHNLPLCVVRALTQSFREPVGWSDRNSVHNSVIGFIVGLGLGGLHAVLGSGNTYLDLVPVDIVNNAIIAAARETAARRVRGHCDVRIYTVSRYRAPLQLKKLIALMKSDRVVGLASPRMVWFPYVLMTTNVFAFSLITWLLHFLPGYIVDEILAFSGKKKKVIRLFDKAYKQNKVYKFFLSNDWKFDDSNLVEMRKNLSPADNVIYNCDMAGIYEDYLVNSTVGTRKYVLKDGLRNTKYATKRYYVLAVLNAIYLALYAYAIWKFVCLVYGISTVSVGAIRDFVCWSSN